MSLTDMSSPSRHSEPFRDFSGSSYSARVPEKVLHLRELAPHEIEDPDLKALTESLGSSSLSTISVATECIGDLTGTTFGVFGQYRIDEIVSCHEHSDTYLASSTRWGWPAGHAHIYSFDGVPKNISGYRRRHLKRTLANASSIQFYAGGKEILLCFNPSDCPYDDPSTSRPSGGREKARIKQQKRRQRKRAQKRTSEHPDSIVNQKDPNRTAKKHRPTPNERSLKFLLGLYEADDPQTDPIPTTEDEWLAILSSSRTLQSAKDDPTEHASFKDQIDLEEALAVIQEDISFLNKKKRSLPRVIGKLKANPEDMNHPKQAMKLQYASRLLVRLIDIMEDRNRRLSDRVQKVTRAFESFSILFYRLESLVDRERPKTEWIQAIRGPLSWHHAGRKQIQTNEARDVEDIAVLKQKKDRAWNAYLAALMGPEPSKSVM